MRSVQPPLQLPTPGRSLPSAPVQELILRHIHDAVFATDLDNRLTYWGHSAERLFGIPATRAIGRPFAAVLPFRIEGAHGESGLVATIRRGAIWRGEGTVTLPDGAQLWLESTVSPITIDGQVVGSVSVARDMTGPRREAEALAIAERALRESEQEFREAFEYATIGMALVGLDGRWLKVNPALVRLLGYSETDLLARSFQDVTHPDDLAADVGALHGLLAGSITCYRRDKRYVHRDGHVTYARLAVSLARDSDGQPRHFVSQVSDRSAEVDLDQEAQIRLVLAEGLRTVPADGSLEHAAEWICREIAGLPWVDYVAVEAFLDGVQSASLARWTREPDRSGLSARAMQARHPSELQARALAGPWAEYRSPESDPSATEDGRRTPLAAVAYGPIANGPDILGVLVVGTCQPDFARPLVERMPGMVAFGTTSSVLLGERLQARRRDYEQRATIERELATRAFRPVFQPIVDLRTRSVVGHEALTRFDAGTRPDRRFSEAWAAGLGPELELAALEAAVSAARGLPLGGWLDVNISPRLLGHAERLRDVLWQADRPLVLEITEHDPVEDYAALREAVRGLGRDLRLAVDDAGAGVANFGHIIELHPDFVKLDMSLVRRVNANLGRQALVVGMGHFARTAGCRLVAEGVETEPEAATLLALGVEYAQGYLFGAPEPAAEAPTRDRPSVRRGEAPR